MVLPREELAQMGVIALTVCSSIALGTTSVAKNALPLWVTPSLTNSSLVGVSSDGEEGKGIKRGPMPSEMQREHSDAKMSSTLEREHLKMFSVCFIRGYGWVNFTPRHAVVERLYVHEAKAVNSICVLLQK